MSAPRLYGFAVQRVVGLGRTEASPLRSLPTVGIIHLTRKGDSRVLHSSLVLGVGWTNLVLFDLERRLTR